MGFTIDLVLVAMDGSDEAATAAEYAIALAERYGADLHLLYVVDQRIHQGIETGDLSATSVAEHQRTQTGAVLERLPDSVGISRSTVLGFRPDRLGQTPGSVTLDAADELGADFIVVPRVRQGEATDQVLGKAAHYVLEYASQPVLSV